jgi:hypothetical protein
MEAASIQRHIEAGTLGNNSTAVADLDGAVALLETFGQRPIARDAQPKAQQMPPLARLRPVTKGGAVVQHGMILDELHIAGLKLHAEMQA